MKKLMLALTCATALVSCAAQPQPWRLFVQPSDRVEHAAAYGYDAQVQPLEDPEL